MNIDTDPTVNASEFALCIEGIAPGRYLDHNDCQIVRMTPYLFLVLRKGEVIRFGGQRTRPNYSAVQIVEFLTGERVPALCARCGVAYRTRKSYCGTCWSVVVTESKQRAKAREISGTLL